MEIWNNSSMASVYFDETPANEHHPCKVSFDDKSILVEYYYYGKMVQYSGLDHGSGHYELTSSDVEGRATLHRMPDSKFLDGYWIEDKQRGMWRITLGK